MFEVKSTREQVREVTGLIKRLADIVPVAICSGNHDNAGGLERTLRVFVPYCDTTNLWESDPVSLKSALYYGLDTLKGAPSLDEIRSIHELPYNAKKPHIMAPGSLTAKPR